MVPLAEGIEVEGVEVEEVEPPELDELPAAVTWIAKGARVLVLLPSLAEITILEYVPASVVLGVPESAPVIKPKVAHRGLFWMLKLMVVPVGLTTVGWKL